MPISHSLLIVDDDPNLSGLLVDLFTSQGYSVRSAMNGHEALSAVHDKLPDMVISDIQMPVMNGFELFETLDRKYPALKKVMMTGCDIDEYLSLIRQQNIGNVLMKGGEFHLNEISRYIEAILTGDIFGLDKHFPSNDINTRFIQRENDALETCEAVLAQYHGNDKIMLEMAINELISNAVFHGVLQMSNTSRDAWNENYAIDDAQPVKVCWALDKDRIGVSVEDPVGGLKKADVLRWLDHPVTDLTENGEEEHGRGLLLVRRIIDRFIINIERGHRTECILIQYKNRSMHDSKKPIIIHEL